MEPLDSEKKFYTLADMAKGKIFKDRPITEKKELDSKYMIDGKYPFVYQWDKREGQIPDSTGVLNTNFYRAFFSCISFPKFKDPSFIKTNKVLITKLVHGHAYSKNITFVEHWGDTIFDLKKNVFQYVHSFYLGKKPPYSPPGKLGYRSFIFLLAINEKEEEQSIKECKSLIEYSDFLNVDQGCEPIVVKIIGRTWGELAVNTEKLVQYTIDEQCKHILNEKEFDRMMESYKLWEEKYLESNI
jgi:hypothetical protein